MSDRFRKNYVELCEASAHQIRELKDAAATLEWVIEAFGKSRETELAITKLEEAVFWATKHLSSPGLQ